MCYIIIFSIVLVNLPVYGSLPETQAVQGFGSIKEMTSGSRLLRSSVYFPMLLQCAEVEAILTCF